MAKKICAILTIAIKAPPAGVDCVTSFVMRRRRGNQIAEGNFLQGTPRLKQRMPEPECTMNIFYIIGVIVVILFVAGFLGLR
ncbi:hypothetical protein [Bradyrhizobium sp.]|uniref:hypothetical protein n=1 Tax=Bradyrhizobium sp. TaxID=376 RepID=UPI00272FDDDA|nr:hypothetical protein [Bradyrhizobium sp.]MDP1869004.1 hypothetical protein [Bradyrhizobium sp.]MDP3077528.1 hypothetical protein [Bradyrhizobium sp.]